MNIFQKPNENSIYSTQKHLWTVILVENYFRQITQENSFSPVCIRVYIINDEYVIIYKMYTKTVSLLYVYACKQFKLLFF